MTPELLQSLSLRCLRRDVATSSATFGGQSCYPSRRCTYGAAASLPASARRLRSSRWLRKLPRSSRLACREMDGCAPKVRAPEHSKRNRKRKRLGGTDGFLHSPRSPPTAARPLYHNPGETSRYARFVLLARSC